jgi:hypothetical protein
MIANEFFVNSLAGLAQLMAVVDSLDGLLNSDGDEQADDDGGDVDEEVAPGVGGLVGRVDVEHGFLGVIWVSAGPGESNRNAGSSETRGFVSRMEESSEGWRRMPRYGDGFQWPAWARPVFLTVFVLLLLWLAMSMKRHHFFDGSRFLNNRNVGSHQ